jgi:hypothetical protein
MVPTLPDRRAGRVTPAVDLSTAGGLERSDDRTKRSRCGPGEAGVAAHCTRGASMGRTPGGEGDVAGDSRWMRGYEERVK